MESLGFTPGVGRKRPDPGLHVRIWDSSSLERLEAIIGGTQAERLVQLRGARRRRLGATWFRRVGNLGAAPGASVGPPRGPDPGSSAETHAHPHLGPGW